MKSHPSKTFRARSWSSGGCSLTRGLTFLDLRETAVRLDIRAVDIAGRIGGQESDDGAHLVRLARAPLRHAADDIGHIGLPDLWLGQGGLQQGCQDRSRADRIDADAARFQLGGPGPGEAAYRRLGG